jgi:RNase P/RNase MRP subunit p30
MYYTVPASQAGKFIVVNTGTADTKPHRTGVYDRKSDAEIEADKLNILSGCEVDADVPSDMRRLLKKLG